MFFGFLNEDQAREKLSDEIVNEILKSKVVIKELQVSTNGRKCRGSLPFADDGITVDANGPLVRFVYHDDRGPDDGETLVSKVYMFEGDEYSW